MSGEDHHSRAGELLPDLVGALDPLQLEIGRHLDIGDHHVRAEFVHGREQCGCVLGHPNDIDPVGGAEERPDALSHQDVVVAEHDPDRHPVPLPRLGISTAPAVLGVYTIPAWRCELCSPRTTSWSGRVPPPCSMRSTKWSSSRRSRTSIASWPPWTSSIQTWSLPTSGCPHRTAQRVSRRPGGSGPIIRIRVWSCSPSTRR